MNLTCVGAVDETEVPEVPPLVDISADVGVAVVEVSVVIPGAVVAEVGVEIDVEVDFCVAAAVEAAGFEVAAVGLGGDVFLLNLPICAVGNDVFS